jgi:5'-deoxynucleotidase YfbR-like HD superfamily hydrolase
MYLTEPTDEFKANEAKAMEFKRQQLQIKKEFSTVLEKLLAEPNDEGALVSDLKALKALIAKTGGLPLGIKKDELYKVIRSKKAKGFWPTNVEIAYQSLQQEISYQQNPNLEKDVGNPYQ